MKALRLSFPANLLMKLFAIYDLRFTSPRGSELRTTAGGDEADDPLKYKNATLALPLPQGEDRGENSPTKSRIEPVSPAASVPPRPTESSRARKSYIVNRKCLHREGASNSNVTHQRDFSNAETSDAKRKAAFAWAKALPGGSK